MVTICTTFSNNRRHSIPFTERTNVYHMVLSTTTVYFPKYTLMLGLCNGNGFCEAEIEFLCITYINFMSPIVKKLLIKHVSHTHAERLENVIYLYIIY
jgi:hypothetical protein